MKITKGKWFNKTIGGLRQYVTNSKGLLLATIIPKSQYGVPLKSGIKSCDEALANAQLIAEAGTVANEIGKTPRQLADENKELLEALTSIVIYDSELIELHNINDRSLKKIHEAIKKATA